MTRCTSNTIWPESFYFPCSCLSLHYAFIPQKIEIATFIFLSDSSYFWKKIIIIISIKDVF